ncbi:hypothetical protein [Roseomonas indoligenes]|uniref:Uncharacterized protein n=1 Tax=Roseomonas indoligenes TaxID=2820811 RepID=A0A940S441_9PROT|nr:hypothetical protein [Pararoseomonas indoligenes]MBP0492896.1 hypothetical protein [Pararoseomonas indoligenes]
MGAGRSHALDGRPTPVSRLVTLRSMKLEVRCSCGRAVDLPVDEVLRLGISPRLCVYELGKRLRCVTEQGGCGQRGAASVVGVKGWGR